MIAWRLRDVSPTHPDGHRAWLLRIAGFEVLNQRRSRRRRSALHDRLAVRLGPDDLVHVDPPRFRGEILTPETQALVAALSEEDWTLLALVAFEGLDLREAAEAVGCSHAAARMRMHRLRRRARGSRVESDRR
jgi:RNA polymerase sigma-70 factor (ECF subfamily)